MDRFPGYDMTETTPTGPGDLPPGEEPEQWPDDFGAAALVAERSWTWRNRSLYGSGPWDAEPDTLMWPAAAPPHYPCMCWRNHRGVWCGYVAIPADHPLHGRGYYDLGDVTDGVHGGCTFTNAGVAGTWVFGFDCGHGFDYGPGDAAMDRWLGLNDKTFPPRLLRRTGPYVEPPAGTRLAPRYRPLTYAREHAERLALHLAQVAAGTRALPPPRTEDDE